MSRGAATDWELEIGWTLIAMQKLYDIDRNRLHVCTPPKRRATIEEIQKSEMHLGFKFDNDYKGFLLKANGWRNFNSLDTHLFGTDDYLNSSGFDDAIDDMQIQLEDVEEMDIGIEEGSVFPVCYQEFGSGAIYLKKSEIAGCPRAFRFGTIFVESYDSFTEYFRANRASIERFCQQAIDGENGEFYAQIADRNS